ncbi:MAG: PAS domain-containing sensor histidine kinase [Nitriliruptorales bacterium]|nr:PAS domain-containing sensor histidine kinase [Nitriliruptorales bacterium]
MADRTAADQQGELDRSDERFRLLVESVVDYAIFMLDTDGYIQSWNRGAERLKGYTEDEIIGQHYSVFYPEEYREQRLPERLLREAREQGRTDHRGWRVKKDGSRFWAHVVITALRENGELTGFAKVTRDMTAAHEAREERERALERQREALEQLEEMDEWRRDFISSITHDLRSPVLSILGFVRLLREGDAEEEEREAFYERIEANAESLETLIDHLRTHALLEAGQITIDPRPVPLDGIVQRVVADMAPVLSENPTQVEIDDIEVSADLAGLERILRNLLSNAARHTPSGGQITIRTDDGQVPNGMVRIEVEDEGEGIPPDRLEAVFDRFERTETGGSGLGLAIVQQYIDLHGGDVGADSTPGEGTTIWFTLPMA